MKRFSYVLTKPHALYAKPAGSLMREVCRFSSSVLLSCGDDVVSIRDMRELTEADIGSRITVTVEGRDEEAAVAAIQNYFVANM